MILNPPAILPIDLTALFSAALSKPMKERLCHRKTTWPDPSPDGMRWPTAAVTEPVPLPSLVVVIPPTGAKLTLVFAVSTVRAIRAETCTHVGAAAAAACTFGVALKTSAHTAEKSETNVSLRVLPHPLAGEAKVRNPRITMMFLSLLALMVPASGGAETPGLHRCPPRCGRARS